MFYDTIQWEIVNTRGAGEGEGVPSVIIGDGITSGTFPSSTSASEPYLPSVGQVFVFGRACPLSVGIFYENLLMVLLPLQAAFDSDPSGVRLS